MKMTRQRLRMEQRARDRGAVVSLNIVSLLDIFTILLLFLLVQAGDPEEALPVLEQLKLPWSASKQPPRRDLVIAVDGRHILVEGKPVARLDELGDGTLIPVLSEALSGYLERARAAGGVGEKFAGRVTIMADREVPFSVLKKVMYTAAASHFGHISLAVQQREVPAS